MYACLQKQVTYVATVFNTTKNLGDDTCVNKSINYIASSGKTSNVFRDTTQASRFFTVNVQSCQIFEFLNPLKICSLRHLASF